MWVTFYSSCTFRNMAEQLFFLEQNRNDLRLSRNVSFKYESHTIGLSWGEGVLLPLQVKLVYGRGSILLSPQVTGCTVFY